jgi:hypothetical protein
MKKVVICLLCGWIVLVILHALIVPWLHFHWLTAIIQYFADALAGLFIVGFLISLQSFGRWIKKLFGNEDNPFKNPRF